MRGSVIKRGKTYSIVYDIGKDSTGKRIQKWESGFPSKKQAERELRARIEQVESSFANKLERATCATYLLYWLKDYCEVNLARNTVNGYRVNIEKHIIPYIGDIPLYKLDPSHITAMYSKLREKGLSSTSILYVHRVLRAALNAAVKHRQLPYNVLSYVDSPKKDKFRPSVLSPSDVQKLLLTCHGSEIHVPVALAVYLGLRRGEVLGLMWSDIDWENRALEIKQSATCYKQEFCLSTPKTKNSNRTLLIPDSLLSILQEHLNGGASKSLWLWFQFLWTCKLSC